MLLKGRDFRGWLSVLILVPVIMIANYYSEPGVRRASFWGDEWKSQPVEARGRPCTGSPRLSYDLLRRRATQCNILHHFFMFHLGFSGSMRHIRS